MIHARFDYDRIQDPANKIPNDEPVFLLRGQDPLAPELLLDWSKRYRLMAGADVKMARAAEDHAMRMLEWQHMHNVHVPDMPKTS